MQEAYTGASIAEQAMGMEYPSGEAIWKCAVEVFDGEDLARQWLNTPLPLLPNQTPQPYADSGDAGQQREASIACPYRLRHKLLAGALGPLSRFQQRDEGVPRRPGGPPYLGCCCSNYLSQANTQLLLFQIE